MSMNEFSTGDEQMKDFIYLTEQLIEQFALSAGIAPVQPPMVVEESSEVIEHPILAECRDLVFKLRSTMEDESGDYALGVEIGMQRAADMIENLIRRFEKGAE